MRFNVAGCVDGCRVNFKPAFWCLSSNKGCTAHIGNFLYGHFGSQSMGNFNHCTFSIAVKQQIAFAVHHNGTSDFVRPIVVVCNPAQRPFNTTQHNGHIRIRLAATLAVNNGSSVWTLTTHVARCVGIVRSNLSIGGVPIDHGVHVARRHTPEQIGFAQSFERVSTLPIGLGNDAHSKTLCF